MIGALAERGTDPRGMRPFNPLRDLRPATELIELAFGDALDRSSREMLREMRTLSWLLGPLFWLMGSQGSPLADFYSGYVWVEDGEVVGNITVHRHYKGRPGWFISNLAVHPAFRRRGIARRLVEAGIDFARGKGARRISLEVKAENEPARALYAKMGFSQVDSLTRMKTDDPTSVTLRVLQEAKNKVVRVRDERECFQLAQEALSPEAHAILPLRESDYVRSGLSGLISDLTDVLQGHSTFRWGAYADGQLGGLLTVRTGAFLAATSLSLMVRPDRRGKVEESLLIHALRTLETQRWRPLQAEIHPSYDLAREVFQRYGFTELETMDLFTLGLSD